MVDWARGHSIEVEGKLRISGTRGRGVGDFSVNIWGVGDGIICERLSWECAEGTEVRGQKSEGRGQKAEEDKSTRALFLLLVRAEGMFREVGFICSVLAGFG